MTVVNMLSFRFFLTLAIVLVAGCSFAQDWAKKRLEDSPRHGEWVELTSGARKVKCFVVYPERKDKATVVVLIHEIFGLSDWAMSAADQLAEHGFIAIAPDLLSGMGPGGGRTDSFMTDGKPDIGKVREAIGGLPPDQVTADLNAASDYAKTIPSANGKVAVAGFCWGGGQTFRFATNRNDLSAACVFYGTGPTDAADVARIMCPVYGFYGGDDNRVNATIPDSTKLMTAASKKYEPVIYDGAGHGFMRAGEQPDAAEGNKKALDAAWNRLVDVLNKV